ncbi:alpha-E domain-containing protein [Formosa sp. S-31]|uniref:alpha-E domain-containing protein n=1 Tax=Formosa sp. S-31 TaxID=2790949 RepID=UPI003EBCE404
MLARIANNLFWMGRYIERAEHLARFINVNYFSSLDAPDKLSRDRQFVLHSICEMVGGIECDKKNLVEEEVLFNAVLNPENPNSILNCVKYARENANTSRDLVSSELYEALNKFYHFVMNYPKDYFKQRGLHDFTSHVTNQTSVLKGKMRSTLLHDDIYSIIKVGINMERATQVTRIIKAKYEDVEQTVEKKKKNPMKNSFEWITLLKCAGAYDLNRRLYKKTPTQLTALEFLIVNPHCTKSVIYSLHQMSKYINRLDPAKVSSKESAAFLINKMHCDYKYKTVEEVEGDVKGFINQTLSTLVQIGTKLENEYFYL